MCLWRNINQDVPFCVTPEYEPLSSSGEELWGFSVVRRLCGVYLTHLTKPPRPLLLSQKWHLMQTLQVGRWDTGLSLQMGQGLKKTNEDNSRDDSAQCGISPA